MTMKMIGHVVWTLAALGGLLIALLYMFQDKILYVASTPPDARTTFIRPERFHIKSYEDHYIPTPDGETINAWLFKTEGDYKKAPTVLYFHGNAGNISHRLPNIAELLRLCKVNVMIVEYRGYGRSSGIPSEIGLQIDAQTALQFLIDRSDINHRNIIVFGRSLGGAVAIDLAARNPETVKALIVENSFTSVPDMVDIVFPPLRYFKWLSKNQWDSESKVSILEMPALFISGRRDDLVPPTMMDRLYNACSSSSKHFLPFENGGHMDTWDVDEYYEALTKWINKNVPVSIN